VRRWVSFPLLCLLGQCLDGSTEGTTRPIEAQAIEIVSTPVALDSKVAGRIQLGALTYLGGWHLTSGARGFGALSGLDVRGNQVTAISDIGVLIRFRIGRFGTISGARIDPVPEGCGRGEHESGIDGEAITGDASGQHWWITLEGRNEICRLDATLTRTEAALRPHALRRWRKKRGPESLRILPGGRWVALEEGLQRPDATHRLALFDRDPTDRAARITYLDYVPPSGFTPTDMDVLPDGRLLILNRRFTVGTFFIAKLDLVDPAGWAAGARLNGRVIADFAPPIITDNLEGISISQEKGRTIIWIASDDNFMRWERTLLLKFAIDIPADQMPKKL
jgi:hypothetical protein